MKWLVMIWLLSGFVNETVAEEFKLDISKEFIDVDPQPSGEFKTQPEKTSSKDDLALPKEAMPLKKIEAEYSGFKEIKPKSDQYMPAQPPEHSEFQLPTPPSRQIKQIQDFGPLPGETPNVLGLLENNSKKTIFQSLDNAEDPFQQMRDDLRILVGEEVYAKMVWSYLDLKQLNNLINSEMSQFNLLVEEWIAKVQEIIGLDDQLRTELILPYIPGSDASRLRLASMSEQYAEMQQNLVNGLNADSLKQATLADVENQSKLFMWFKYLTIKNFIYFILMIIGGVYVAKLFKFLVRQQ